MLNIYIAKVNDKVLDLKEFLEEEQILKANKFKQIDDYKRSILSSTLLNFILKKNELSISDVSTNEFGKPFIKTNQFYFNISHSGEYVVCVTNSCDVGIDIEKVRCINDLVLSKCFTKEEQEYIKSDLDFTKVWTLKESYIKCLGTGLRTRLNTFSVIKNSEISKVNDLMFTSLYLDDYVLSICTNNTNKTKIHYLDF